MSCWKNFEHITIHCSSKRLKFFQPYAIYIRPLTKSWIVHLMIFQLLWIWPDLVQPQCTCACERVLIHHQYRLFYFGILVTKFLPSGLILYQEIENLIRLLFWQQVIQIVWIFSNIGCWNRYPSMHQLSSNCYHRIPAKTWHSDHLHVSESNHNHIKLYCIWHQVFCQSAWLWQIFLKEVVG